MSMGWSEIGWWALLVGGLAGTAMYSGVETGVYCLNRVRLRLRAAHGPRRESARIISRELEHPERMLGANLIANLVCGDMAATAASRLLANAGYSDWFIILANVAVFTPVFFVLVESVPKELFRIEADRATYRFAWVLPLTRWVLTALLVLPLVRALTAAAARLVGGEREVGLERSAIERVASLVRDSAGSGAVSEAQAGLVDRALRFQRGMVGEEMVPWSDVHTVGEDATLGQLREAIERSGEAYVPVLSGRGGRSASVVGVVWHADAILRAGQSVRSMVVAPARVTPRTPLPEAIARLKGAAAPVAIVEEGERAVGLVTMDDLVGPLVGRED